MATSALPVVTSALYGLLESAGLSANVYRYVPQKPAFPYVTIKSGTENRLDTFGRAGKSLLLQVHVHTSSAQYAGDGQALAILAAIHAATNYAKPTLAGFDCLVCRPEDAFDAGTETVNGVDYYHFVQTIRVEVMPA
jgi:hypothetical protein